MKCPASQRALSPTATRTTWHRSLGRPHLSDYRSSERPIGIALAMCPCRVPVRCAWLHLILDASASVDP
jgi:hypothetical protein